MRFVFLKTLYDKRWFILGWTLGLAAMTVLMVVFFPAMKTEGSLDFFVQSLPEAFQGLIGDLENLRHFSTYIATQLFDIRLTILQGVMAIILALGLSVAEEERGQLRTLLSLPYSRTRVLVEKFAAIVAINGIGAIGVAVSIVATVPFIDESIQLDELLRLTVMAWLLMIALSSVTFAAGIMSGKRAVAMVVGMLVVVGGFILSTFGSAVDWLEPYQWLSLFEYFPAVDVVKDGIIIEDVLVLGGVSIVALVLGWIGFVRRDIG